jgi:hypothetical protein
MSKTHDHLMNFQEFLLDTFYKHTDVDTIQHKLEQYNNDAIMQNWVTTLSPEMLEVAARMTQHWGKKSSS